LEILEDSKAAYEPSTETLEQCIDIFSIFANIDTMRIFLLAEKGISNSNITIKKLDLTPKRYYSRLKELVDSGVIEKVNGIYVYTPVGEVLHNLGLSLINLIGNKQKISLLLHLSKSEALSDEERQKINSVIIGKNNMDLMLGSMIKSVPYEKIEKISEYKMLVEALTHSIATSKNSILLASKYFEIGVVDESLKALERGNELRVLIAKETMSNKMNKLKIMLSPKIILKALEMANEKNIGDILRETEIPYSFCIIDDLECFFEFPNVGGEFSIAFKLKDSTISKKFIKIFNSIWDSLNQKNPAEFLKKIS